MAFASRCSPPTAAMARCLAIMADRRRFRAEGLATTSATLLHNLFADPAHLERFVAEIKEVEHQADDITRDVINRIDKSFVTPIDREDIHLLVSQLDNVVDLIDGTARRAAMFHITEVKEPAKRLCDVLNVTDVSDQIARGMERAYASAATPDTTARNE